MALRIVRPDTAFALSTGRKRPRVHSATHLEWLRTLPCAVTGGAPVEAAHIRYGDMTYGKRETGKSEKPDDKWCLPLSPVEHRKQHAMNEREYWRSVGIDPLLVALKLWANTGDDRAAEVILSLNKARSHLP